MTCDWNSGFKHSIAKEIAGYNCNGSRDHATSSAQQAHKVGDTADGVTQLSDADAIASEMTDLHSRLRNSCNPCST